MNYLFYWASILGIQIYTDRDIPINADVDESIEEEVDVSGLEYNNEIIKKYVNE